MLGGLGMSELLVIAGIVSSVTHVAGAKSVHE